MTERDRVAGYGGTVHYLDVVTRMELCGSFESSWYNTDKPVNCMVCIAEDAERDAYATRAEARRRL